MRHIKTKYWNLHLEVAKTKGKDGKSKNKTAGVTVAEDDIVAQDADPT
jgi:hypothetical protein